MTQLLFGAALLFGGVLALRLSKHSKSWRIASSDGFAVTAALTVTTMIAMGIGLLATGIFLVAE